MTAPLPHRKALEAASAYLKQGRVPPKAEALRIADTLDAVVLAIVQSNATNEPAVFTEQPNTRPAP